MPVLVDHEKTRDHIAELACRIVASEGLHALTMRRLAAEAGASRAIVSTYFRDMRDLVLATFHWVAARQVDRFEAAQSAGGGLHECVEALLPLDEASLNEWRVTIAYIGYAVADEELADIERRRIDGAVVRFERLLVAERGMARGSVATHREAQRIVSALLGVAIDHSFDAASHAQHRARRLLVERVLGSQDS